MTKSKHHKPNQTATRGASSTRDIDDLIASQQYDKACENCERLLEKTPNDSALLSKLGTLLIHLKRFDEAKDRLDRALRVAPNDPAIHNNLGIAREKNKELAAAESSYRRSLELAPNMPEAHSNLADLLIKLKRPDEAIVYARKALQLAPSSPLCWQALGDALQMHGDTQEAQKCFEKAIALPPPNGKSFVALARAYLVTGRRDEAASLLRKAIEIFGEDPRILNDLGLTLGSMQRYEEAQPLFEKAYEILNEPTTLFNILTNLRFQKKEEAIVALADEVLTHPQPNVALAPLFDRTSATCMWDLQERLLPHFLEWCTLNDSKLTTAAQNLLTILPTSVNPMTVKAIAEKVAEAYREQIRHYRLDINHERAHASRTKLRIGYLSSDFRLHAVNYFIAGLLSHYDKQNFEVFCYSNLAKDHEDEITQQYKQAVDAFVRVEDMSDADLARRIAADGIHILVDLSGYTAGTRMIPLYLRPAPIQLTYLGYPFTTGIRDIDYTLADSWLNSPENEAAYVEKIIEIPLSCYSCSGLPVSPEEGQRPPLAERRFVTFGSLNNSYKLNRPTIAAWSRILSAVPGSRLVLNNPNYASPLTQRNVVDEFGKHGITRDRFTIVSTSHPKGSHLHWYEDIDIALDAFPQTGGTTTFEATWMGVPVITLVGHVLYERLSYSALKSCGTEVDDLIAFDVDSYVEKAVALAQNPARIEELHAALPRNIRHSVFGDPARHIRFFEEALITAWNRKFPDEPRFVAEQFAYAQMNTPAAPWVATVPAVDNLYHYVVTEQGRWFTSEYEFLSLLCDRSSLAVEIGSEPGFYCLELAHAGVQTLCLATSTVSGRLIRAAADKGGVADKVEIRLESPKSTLLDRADLHDVGLLRIGAEANDGNAGPINKNPNFWKTNAPVVLTSVHQSDGSPDLSVAQRLASLGYSLYRLMPSLGSFVPWTSNEAIDPYSLYLLACPPDKKPALIASGILVEGPKVLSTSEIPDLSEDEAAGDPLTQTDQWILECSRRGLDKAVGPAAQWAYLNLALRSQLTLIASAPTTSRRMTLVRLLTEVGRRADAVAQLNQCLAEIENGSAQVTFPFIGPSSTWDVPPNDENLAAWLFAALVETRYRLAVHSTFFLSPQELDNLSALTTVGFETDFVRNVRQARLLKGG